MASQARSVIDTAAQAGADHLAPVYAQFPLEVASAAGVYLETTDGRRVGKVLAIRERSFDGEPDDEADR